MPKFRPATEAFSRSSIIFVTAASEPFTLVRFFCKSLKFRALNALVNQASELAAGIPKVQQEIWNATEAMECNPQWEIVRDLAYDIEYYQASQRVQSEDKSHYGEERALSEIRQALEKLKMRGESEC